MSSAFTNTFWTLVPSITAIVLVLIIREPHVSLFIAAGFVQNAVICLAVGVVLVVATLTVIRKVEQSRVINN